RDFALEHIQYLPVGDFALLEILFYGNSALVTDALHTFWHERIASVITLAHIAVDPTPSIFAFALFAFLAQWPIDPISKSAANRLLTIHTTKSRRAFTKSIVRPALCKLRAIKGRQ